MQKALDLSLSFQSHHLYTKEKIETLEWIFE